MKTSERWSFTLGNCHHSLAKTGRTVKIKQFNQCVVHLEGSSHSFLQNRKFFHKFLSVQKCRERCFIIQDFKFFPIQAMVDPLFQPSLLLLPRMYFLKEHTGSKISYFGDNNLLLLQFKPGGNDDKNHSEHFRDNKK